MGKENEVPYSMTALDGDSKEGILTKTKALLVRKKITPCTYSQAIRLLRDNTTSEFKKELNSVTQEEIDNVKTLRGKTAKSKEGLNAKK